MKNCESQVILYAKNWFEKENTLDDLRKIYAKRNLLELEHISDEDIYSMLTFLVFDLCIKDKDSYLFTDLMAEIFRFQDGRFGYSQVTSRKNVIKKYLLMLRLLQVKEVKNGEIIKILIELDEPDYTILPKRKVEKNVRVLCPKSKDSPS